MYSSTILSSTGPKEAVSSVDIISMRRTLSLSRARLSGLSLSRFRCFRRGPCRGCFSGMKRTGSPVSVNAPGGAGRPGLSFGAGRVMRVFLTPPMLAVLAARSTAELATISG
jgi:hypothetical protein